jgi:hypothetical protein
LAQALAPPDGQPPELDTARPPDVVAEQRGVRLELWVPQEPVVAGGWLPALVRVTNGGRSRVWHSGDIRNLACKNPTWTEVNIAGLFDPGQTWTGNAAAFKEEVLGSHSAGRLVMSATPSDSNDDACLDFGVEQPLRPGASFEVPSAVWLHYPWRDQPLPGGSTTVAARYQFWPRALARGEPILLEVSAPVTIAGVPVEYASPQTIADAVLADPAFMAYLERCDLTTDWNTTLQGIFPEDEEVTFAELGYEGGPAPIETVTLSLFADCPPPGSWAQAYIDPWLGSLESVLILGSGSVDRHRLGPRSSMPEPMGCGVTTPLGGT